MVCKYTRDFFAREFFGHITRERGLERDSREMTMDKNHALAVVAQLQWLPQLYALEYASAPSERVPMGPNGVGAGPIGADHWYI